MIVIDSSAMVAIAYDEPDRPSFVELIGAAESCFMSAMTYLESSIVVARGQDQVALKTLDDIIAQQQIMIVPLDEVQAKLAREAFLRYGKGRHPAGLNFGDCASYALAKSRGVPLLFKGDDFSKTDVMPAA